MKQIFAAHCPFQVLIPAQKFQVFTSILQGNENADASNLLSRYRRSLAKFGIRPESGNYDLRYALSSVYCLIYLVVGGTGLKRHTSDFEVIVMNLIAGSAGVLSLIKMTLSHRNRTLSQVIDAVREDCANNQFTTIEERRRYAAYYSMAMTFYKIVIPLSYISTIFMCLKPLAGYLIATSHNGTITYGLPYQGCILFEIKNVYTYAVAYTFHTGALYMICCGNMTSDGVLITLTMHLCGQLSALAESIANSTNDSSNARFLAIDSIVKRHLRSIWMVKRINNVYGVVYLSGVLGYASLICLVGFTAITNSEATEISLMAACMTAILATLYGNCFVGECLIEESQRVRNAFYQCSWYEMPLSRSKDLIICIAACDKPLSLTTAKSCELSLTLFVQVVKTAVGYISVLRNLM